ncbi:MAG: hypothetical protein JO030_00615 [Candidatus Eremiobacteraeota bacterium]|nr:hypothetical protein [Candidatus Eremiobacteraeota bacterium]
MKLSKRVVPAFWCAVGACVQAGCSFSGSPADGLTFHAPPGWSASPGIMGFMQFWRPPSNDHEVLMLFRSPKPLRASDVLSTKELQGTLHDMTVERRTTIQICGNQAASYFEGRGHSAKGDEKTIMVMTNTRSVTYLALYVRPIDRAPNGAAQAAVRELCAKP